MMRFFYAALLGASVLLATPTAFAALASGERCVCTAKDGLGATQDYAATDGSDCDNASNEQWSCSVQDTSHPNQPSGSEGFVPLAPIPGLTEGISPTQADITVFLNNLYIFLIGITVILAIGMIIWGGFEYALSEAIPAKTAGRQKIMNALFGLVLVLSPALVFYIINPAILNLSVNFPPLKTKWGDYKPPTACSWNNDFCKSEVATCRASGGTAKCERPGLNGRLFDPGISGGCIDQDIVRCVPK